LAIGLAVTPLLAQEPASQTSAAQTTSPATEPAPIYVESDSLLIDDQKGVSTYTGDVLFRQGGDSLKADKVRIFAQERKDVEKVVADGKPARFDHKAMLPDEEDAWGEAERIEYFVEKELIIFQGEAFFKQGDNTFAGPRIEYSAATRQVKAGNTQQDTGRVHITIQPRAKESATDPAQPKEASAEKKAIDPSDVPAAEESAKP